MIQERDLDRGGAAQRRVLEQLPPAVGQGRAHLTFEEHLDKDFIARVRRERGFGVNPWAAHSRFLVSHRLLIDETYAGPLRNWLGDFRPGTLLILDEAHHAAQSSGQRYAIDSQITRAIHGLSPRFEHRLFLSATPHKENNRLKVECPISFEDVSVPEQPPSSTTVPATPG